MKPITRLAQSSSVIFLIITGAILLGSFAQAQDTKFHNAPASSKEMKNPYEGQDVPHAKALFHLRCARCHGENGEGSGNIPPLNAERIKAAAPGEIFWFITQGDVPNGMPSWAKLPKQQRWQIVSYVKTGQAAKRKGEQTGACAGGGELNAAASEAAVYGLPL